MNDAGSRGASRVTAVRLEIGRLAQVEIEAMRLAFEVVKRGSLADAARLDTELDRSSLWAGLFDLRDTLLGSTVDDLRALAA